MKNCLSALISISVLIVGTVPAPVQSQEVEQVAQLTSVSNAQLEQAKVKAEKFINSLGNQEFERSRADLNPSLRAEWPANKIQQQWQRLLKDTGSFKKVLNSRTTEALGDYLVIVTVEFEDITNDLLVTLNGNQQIIALDFLWLGDIQRNAEKFVDALAAKDFALARTYLANPVKQRVLPKDIQQRWQNSLKSTGPVIQRLDSRVVKGVSSDIVLVNIKFAKRTGSLAVAFNSYGRIVGVDFPQTK